MTTYAFVEVKEGSGLGLQRLIGLVGRLSQCTSVVLKLDSGMRPRVETILQGLPDADCSRIKLLENDRDRTAMIPAVQGAGFCVFSDTDLVTHLRPDQVAVFFRSGRT